MKLKLKSYHLLIKKQQKPFTTNLNLNTVNFLLKLQKKEEKELQNK